MREECSRSISLLSSMTKDARTKRQILDAPSISRYPRWSGSFNEFPISAPSFYSSLNYRTSIHGIKSQ